jgi:hypothetical protein
MCFLAPTSALALTSVFEYTLALALSLARTCACTCACMVAFRLVHVFGHVHDGAGVTWGKRTVSANAACASAPRGAAGSSLNPIIIVDICLPPTQ